MNVLSRIVGVGILVLVIGYAAVHTMNNKTDTTTTENTSSAQKQMYAIDTAKLDGILPIIDSSGLVMSVSVTDLQTGEQYHYGDDASFTAASIGKLITAITYLHQVEVGKANLSNTVGTYSAKTQLEKMLVDSDNTAWHDMREFVTTEGQQTYAKSIGLTSYDASTNTITSSDIAILLQKIASGHLLNNKHSQLLLSYMQRANYRSFIVASVPDNVTVYHKVGLLEDRLHDAAIIKKGDRSYVLVIFSKSAGVYSFSKGASVFGEITDKTLETFFDSQESLR